MSRQIAKVKSTGGYGFKFEDKVAATCLIRMFDGLEVFGLKGLRARGITFQAHASGWLLDDLLLDLSGPSGECKCAVSVKSAAYLTKDGFKSEFVADLWDQWHGADGNPFESNRDYLALAVGRLSEAASTAWEDIAIQAPLSEPQHLANQLSTDGSSSPIERKIFASLLPDAELKKGTTVADAARLLSRLAMQHFGNQTDAIGARDCAALLLVEDASDGKELWEKLLSLASEYRIAGGTIGLDKLLELLRAHFSFKEHPDYSKSWGRLNQRSLANCDAVHSVAGSDTAIDLSSFITEVEAKSKRGRVLAIVGDSGVGKSSLTKGYVHSLSSKTNLVWLTGEELAVQNQTILAKEVGTIFELPNLVRYSTKPLLLVVDAIEQFSALALRRLSEIVVALRSVTGLDFRVLLTTQPLRWGDIRAEVYSWKTEGVDDLPFSGPAFESVSTALSENAMVRPLLFRPELRRVVTNLATLDQIVKVVSVQQLTTDRTWIGETEIIDWVWKHWLGGDASQHQRAALLRLLGEKDATYGPVIPVSHLPYETTTGLGDPMISSLTHTDSNGVRFNHEVVADWARYHFLKGEGPSRHAKILELIRNPRWTRAIRLYSQSLLEQTEGLSAWETVFGSFGVGDSENQVAADVFSDSLVLATNSAELLARVWPALIADNGRRLKRLMKRIMIVGTIPLPSADLGEEYTDAVSVVMRFPVPAYWDGLLQVLSSHSDAVAANCLSEAGELCAFYLRVMPVGYGRRRLVSALVLKLAAEAESGLAERKYYLRDASKTVFEALLRAAAEFPDEVGKFAISLGERSPVVNSTTETVKVVRSTGISRRLLGRIRKPWPHGPHRRVEESFRNAVLQTDALSALMVSRPQIASEVLLAVCIEEPQNEYEAYQSARLDDGGFAFWHGHMPAMYFNGPFLFFLRASPRIALETIIKLVDFGTDRWLEGFHRFNGPEITPSYKLYFEGFDKTFIGDGNVYNWHREMRDTAVFVESALMAVEKWLYERIDAKEDVSDAVNQMLTETKSAAFLGLLVSVGLYSPGLFNSPLRPLLSCPDLYTTQRSTLLGASWKFLFEITWGRYGKRVSDEVRTWNEMPHRRYELYELARRLLFFNNEAAVQLEIYRKRWQAEAASEANANGVLPTTLEVFTAQLDRDNYTVSDAGNGQVAIEFHAPKALEARLIEERKGPALNLSAMSLIAEAGRSIDEANSLTAEQAESIYQRLREIVSSDRRDGTFAFYRKESISAGVALLLVVGENWLAGNPEAEALCVEHLLALSEEPPTPTDCDSPESISGGYDLFLAEAALHLVLRNRGDDRLWSVLLRGITSNQYKTTEKIMMMAFRHRTSKAIRFNELAGAVILWAVIRGPVGALGSRFDSTTIAPYQKLVASRFKRGYFKERVPSLAFAAQANDRFARMKLRGTPQWDWHEQRTQMLESRSATNMAHRERLHRRETYLDLEVLHHGFSFLGQFEGLRSDDAADLRRYFDQLLRLELDLLPNSPNADSVEFQNQYEFDDWIMALASLYYATVPLSEALQTVAQPIMSLGAGAHYWIQDFLQAFFRYAPGLCMHDADLANRWRALIQFAASSARWDYDQVGLKYYLEHLFRELLGFSGYPSRAADGALRGALVLLKPELVSWCDRWLKLSDAAAAFAKFVSGTNSHEFIELGLIKLADNLSSYGKNARRQEDLTSSLLAAVQHVWKFFPDIVRTVGPASDAFHKVLSFLSALLIPEAIDLQAKVARG
jgi:hypothetical protein